jgi:hypothetical protein
VDENLLEAFLQSFCRLLSKFLVQKYMFRNFWSLESGEKAYRYKLIKPDSRFFALGRKEERRSESSLRSLSLTVPADCFGAAFLTKVDCPRRI